MYTVFLGLLPHNPSSINYGCVWDGYKSPDLHFKASDWIAEFCSLHLYRNFPNFSILYNKGLLTRSLTYDSGHASFAFFEHVAFMKSSFTKLTFLHAELILYCFMLWKGCKGYLPLHISSHLRTFYSKVHCSAV